MATEKGVERALSLIRLLPRIDKYNVKPNPKEFRRLGRCRGQYGGTTHGHGNKGAKQRCSYVRAGFENGQVPMYLRIPMELYYKDDLKRRQYPPVSLASLQLMIDTGRLDPTVPIDLTSICNTKLYHFNPYHRHFGIHLTDEGADNFTAKVNIEVQHAKETVIAAVERNGGVITNAYYDVESLNAMKNPQRFFELGIPIPHRKLPPEDAIKFYTDPKCRGYLADPDRVAEERYALAQKFGYKLPDITKDSLYEMLTMRKDARQIFYGLEPGWLVILKDEKIFKPKDEQLQEYYRQ